MTEADSLSTLRDAKAVCVETARETIVLSSHVGMSPGARPMATRSAKQLALEMVERLPEDATIEDAMERLALLSDIERGLADMEAGRTVSHEEALARLGVRRD